MTAAHLTSRCHGIGPVSALLGILLLSGCNPDQANLQRVADARAAAHSNQIEMLSRQADAARTAAPQSPADDPAVGIALYPGAKPFLAGAAAGTQVSGVRTQVFTTSDAPAAVESFYRRRYPPSGTDPVEGTVWKSVKSLSTSAIRCTIPNLASGGGFRTIQIKPVPGGSEIELTSISGTSPRSTGKDEFRALLTPHATRGGATTP